MLRKNETNFRKNIKDKLLFFAIAAEVFSMIPLKPYKGPIRSVKTPLYNTQRWYQSNLWLIVYFNKTYWQLHGVQSNNQTDCCSQEYYQSRLKNKKASIFALQRAHDLLFSYKKVLKSQCPDSILKLLTQPFASDTIWVELIRFSLYQQIKKLS